MSSSLFDTSYDYNYDEIKNAEEKQNNSRVKAIADATGIDSSELHIGYGSGYFQLYLSCSGEVYKKLKESLTSWETLDILDRCSVTITYNERIGNHEDITYRFISYRNKENEKYLAYKANVIKLGEEFVKNLPNVSNAEELRKLILKSGEDIKMGLYYIYTAEAEKKKVKCTFKFIAETIFNNL